MKRRHFIKTSGLSSLGLASGIVFMGEGITSCEQCRRGWECCRKSDILLRPTELELLRQRKPDLQVIDGGTHDGLECSIIESPCPFFNVQSKKCSVYEIRPFVCRWYYCDNWGFSHLEQKIIYWYHHIVWNYGKNAA